MGTEVENLLRERWVRNRYADSSGRIDYGAYFDDLQGRPRGTPNPIVQQNTYSNAEWLVRERVIESQYQSAQSRGSIQTYQEYRTQWLKDQQAANPLNRSQPITTSTGNNGTALQRSQSPVQVVEAPKPKPFNASPIPRAIGGAAAVVVADQVVQGIYKSKPVQGWLQDRALDLSSAIRQVFGGKPLTQEQRQWFRDNPGKSPNAANGYPQNNTQGFGTDSGNSGNGGQSGNGQGNGAGSGTGANQSNGNGQSGANGYNAGNPATNNANRSNGGSNAGQGSWNNRQGNVGTGNGFRVNNARTNGNWGVGNGNDSQSLNLNDYPQGTYSITGFFEAYQQGGNLFQNQNTKAINGIPKQVTFVKTDLGGTGLDKVFEVTINITYKPNQFDPEVTEQVHGFRQQRPFYFNKVWAVVQRATGEQERKDPDGSTGQSGPPPGYRADRYPGDGTGNIGAIGAIGGIAGIGAIGAIGALGGFGSGRAPNPTPPPRISPPPGFNPSPPPIPGSPPGGETKVGVSPPPSGQPGGTTQGKPGTSTQGGTQVNGRQGVQVGTPNPITGNPGTNGFTPTTSTQTGTNGRTPTFNPVDPNGRISDDAVNKINKDKEPAPIPNNVTPPVCQHDPCIAELQRNNRENGNQLVEIEVPKFLFWNRIGGARFVPEKVSVPQNMVGFAMMMGNRTSDIRARFGRHELVQRLQGFMNALTTITVIHNAAMLSRSLAETLGDLATNAFQTFAPFFGVPDETAQAFNLNEVLGKQTDEFMKSVLGEDVWTGTKQNWLKANRIISTASNIVWTVRSIGDSTQQIAEWTAENTGKIGNALKRFRVVGENAYSWMPERVNGQSAFQNRLRQFMNSQENIEDAASSLNSTISEVRNVKDEFKELKEQRENFDKAVKEALPNSRPDNDATKNAAQSSNNASKSPTLQLTDREKGGSAQ